MRIPHRLVAVLGVVLALCLVTLSVPAAATSQTDGPVAEELGVERVPLAGSEPSGGKTTKALLFCTFYNAGDHVHISTWNGTPGAARSASGHGWWINGNCNATKANVKIWLQLKVNGKWVDVAYGYKNNVYAGGGSANRAVAQVVCSNSLKREWRSKIDVDLIGIADSSDKYYTTAQTVACTPQGY